MKIKYRKKQSFKSGETVTTIRGVIINLFIHKDLKHKCKIPDCRYWSGYNKNDKFGLYSECSLKKRKK